MMGVYLSYVPQVFGLSGQKYWVWCCCIHVVGSVGVFGDGWVRVCGIGLRLGYVGLFGGVHLVAMAMGVVTQTGAHYGFVIDCGLF